jgi:hypothetical protein
VSSGARRPFSSPSKCGCRKCARTQLSNVTPSSGSTCQRFAGFWAREQRPPSAQHSDRPVFKVPGDITAAEGFVADQVKRLLTGGLVWREANRPITCQVPFRLVCHWCTYAYRFVAAERSPSIAAANRQMVQGPVVRCGRTGAGQLCGPHWQTHCQIAQIWPAGHCLHLPNVGMSPRDCRLPP